MLQTRDTHSSVEAAVPAALRATRPPLHASARDTRAATALLVFVQELADLINRERRIFSIERFLTLALFLKLALLFGILASGQALVCVVDGTNVENIGTSEPCCFRRGVVSLCDDIVSAGIKRARRSTSGRGIAPFVRELLLRAVRLKIKRSNAPLPLRDRRIRGEFFCLRVVLQFHVRPQQAIDQARFLTLSKRGGGKRRGEQQRD